jgi:hypothetical protein
MFEDYPEQHQDPTTFAINDVIRTLMDKAAHIIRGSEASSARDGLPVLPEAEAIEVQDIRSAVANQLHGYHSILRNELERGVVGHNIGAGRGTDLLEVLISKASLEGDTATIDACVDTLGQLARHGRSELADAAWAGRLYIKAALSGSSRAYTELHSRLFAEHEYQKGFEGNRTYAPYGTYLLGAVHELSRHGQPAQELIDLYAVNPSRKLSYYMAYLNACREHKAAPRTIDAIQLQIAAQYEKLPKEGITDDHLMVQLLLSLNITDTRWSMFNTFMEASIHHKGGLLLGPAAYEELFDALLFIPPSELNDTQREYLKTLADAGRETIGGTRFELWKVDAAVADGRSPEDVVKHIQEIASKDERRASEAGQTQLVKEVDQAMAKYAVRYSAVAEFGGAQAFLEAISDPHRTAQVLTECMLLTQTPQQRAILRPGDMKMILYPGLATYAELAGLLAQGDKAPTDDIMAAIRKFTVDQQSFLGIATYGSSLEAEAQYSSDVELCDLALRRLPPSAATGLAREIKDKLSAVLQDKTIDEHYRIRCEKVVRGLGEVLVRLGESTETKERYARLYNTQINPTDPHVRLAACMDLADMLFDRRLVKE